MASRFRCPALNVFSVLLLFFASRGALRRAGPFGRCLFNPTDRVDLVGQRAAPDKQPAAARRTMKPELLLQAGRVAPQVHRIGPPLGCVGSVEITAAHVRLAGTDEFAEITLPAIWTLNAHRRPHDGCLAGRKRRSMQI